MTGWGTAPIVAGCIVVIAIGVVSYRRAPAFGVATVVAGVAFLISQLFLAQRYPNAPLVAGGDDRDGNPQSSAELYQ